MTDGSRQTAPGGDPQAALDYHRATKHSLESVGGDRHRLDWAIQPLPFKIYEDLEPIALPRALGESGSPALGAIAAEPGAPATVRTPSLASLARLLWLSAGVTREKAYPGGQRMYFRAAACTGALYHIELYVVAGDLDGLEAGVYHFGAHDSALRRLRGGDWRRLLIDASGGEPALTRAPVMIACTSTFWRNAWKYRARAYRHCYWDNGTLLANLLAVAQAEGLAARVVLGFADGDVTALLGLDQEREVALSLVAIGGDDGALPPPCDAPAELHLRTTPLSSREVAYPTMNRVHAASSLAGGDDARRWRTRTPHAGDDSLAGEVIALPADDSPAGMTLERTVLARGSARSFSRRPISLAQLATMLARSTVPVSFDFRPGVGEPLCGAYLIVNAVEGLAPGAYVYRREERALVRLRSGDSRERAGSLGLGQALAADAAVNIYFLCDLARVLSSLGARGYRAAQLEAAVYGGRVYLASYAMGLAATGLTFFDDDVTSFFSPHAADQSVMFLVAVGSGAKRGRERAG